MFKEPSQPLHPTEPALSSARLYRYFLEDGEDFACVLVILGSGFNEVSHGLGLATIDTRRQGSADQWRGLAKRWLRELEF